MEQYSLTGLLRVILLFSKKAIYSCYFLTWKFCERLLKIPILQTPVTEELCCYGDFMRPMGSNPKLDYIEKCKV